MENLSSLQQDMQHEKASTYPCWALKIKKRAKSQRVQQPLEVENSPQLTPSKKTGTSILQPQEIENSAKTEMSKQMDCPKMCPKGMQPADILGFAW